MTIEHQIQDLQKRIQKLEQLHFPERNDSLMDRWIEAVKSGDKRRAMKIRKEMERRGE